MRKTIQNGNRHFRGIIRRNGKRKFPPLCSRFHTQAAYAFADAQFEQATLSHARSAFHLFSQCHLEKRAKKFYFVILQVLANRDMNAAMYDIQHEFGAKLGMLQADTSEFMITAHGQLPTNCPECGAPLDGSEVQWKDKDTAECNYCGSIIRSVN